MVFVRQEAKPQHGFNVGIILNRKATKGDVGIEIEVEGKAFPKPPGAHGTHHPTALPDLPVWSYVHDGSLRGEDNAEYVLSRPVKFTEAEGAIRDLFDLFAKNKSRIDESNRTSVHVHLNCQAFHFNRLTTFAALYFAVEEILTAWCGEHRVGNLFCLRAKDAPALVTQFKKFIQTDGKFPIRENLHYAGLNVHSLLKYGSLEVRTLRGVSDPDVIVNWVRILQRLYELSGEFDDPRGVCDIFSAEGAMPFFENVFGPLVPVIRNGVGMTDEEVRDSMFEGIRLAQDLCYCRDWDLFKALEIKPDPFGRDSKKMARKLMDNATAAPAGGYAISPTHWEDNEIFDPEFD